MLHEKGSKWLILTPLTGDAQSSFPPEMVAMMGSCCGTGRGSRARWRKPLWISVQGKGPEGRGLERRSTGARVVGCRLVSVGTFLAACFTPWCQPWSGSQSVAANEVSLVRASCLPAWSDRGLMCVVSS